MEQKKIIKKQTILIHLALNQLKISREKYEEMLSDYWVKSSKDLTYDEASELIGRFVKMGFLIITKKYDKKKKLPPDILQLPSKEILAKINHLIADIQWRIRPDGYQRWLRKFLHIERPRTMIEAQKIVEGLKGMLKRQQNTMQDTHTMQDAHTMQDTGCRMQDTHTMQDAEKNG